MSRIRRPFPTPPLAGHCFTYTGFVRGFQVTPAGVTARSPALPADAGFSSLNVHGSLCGPVAYVKANQPS